MWLPPPLINKYAFYISLYSTSDSALTKLDAEETIEKNDSEDKVVIEVQVDIENTNDESEVSI